MGSALAPVAHPREQWVQPTAPSFYPGHCRHLGNESANGASSPLSHLLTLSHVYVCKLKKKLNIYREIEMNVFTREDIEPRRDFYEKRPFSEQEELWEMKTMRADTGKINQHGLES